LGVLSVVAWRPEVLEPVSVKLATMADELRERKLNPLDTANLQRGYYEDLGEVGRFNNELWTLYGMRPTDWVTPAHTRRRDDAMLYDYAPSMQVEHKRVVRTTNQYGMRDREYSKAAPAGVIRLGLVGSSHDAGVGVGDGETYENLIEERLNRELVGGGVRGFEVLNFSCRGYDPIQKLAASEIKALDFDLDVLFFVCYSNEFLWMFESVEELIETGHIDGFPFLREVLDRADVEYSVGAPVSDSKELKARLRPHAPAVCREVFARLRESCRSRGVRPVVVLNRIPEDGAKRRHALDRVSQIAYEAGLEVIDLHSAYARVRDFQTLYLAPWDTHTNASGHRLLADRLYEGLLERKIVPGKDSRPVTTD
jgi:hypothetical protein